MSGHPRSSRLGCDDLHNDLPTLGGLLASPTSSNDLGCSPAILLWTTLRRHETLRPRDPSNRQDRRENHLSQQKDLQLNCLQRLRRCCHPHGSGCLSYVWFRPVIWRSYLGRRHLRLTVLHGLPSGHLTEPSYNAI